jgi:hypothetical protein
MTAIFPERTTGFWSKVCDGHPSQAESFKIVQPVNLWAKCASLYPPTPTRQRLSDIHPLAVASANWSRHDPAHQLSSEYCSISTCCDKKLKPLDASHGSRLGAATKSQGACTTEQVNVETSISGDRHILDIATPICIHLRKLPNPRFGTPWKYPMSA